MPTPTTAHHGLGVFVKLDGLEVGGEITFEERKFAHF
jgi:hypothetical protein